MSKIFVGVVFACFLVCFLGVLGLSLTPFLSYIFFALQQRTGDIATAAWMKQTYCVPWSLCDLPSNPIKKRASLSFGFVEVCEYKLGAVHQALACINLPHSTHCLPRSAVIWVQWQSWASRRQRLRGLSLAVVVFQVGLGRGVGSGTALTWLLCLPLWLPLLVWLGAAALLVVLSALQAYSLVKTGTLFWFVFVLLVGGILPLGQA